MSDYNPHATTSPFDQVTRGRISVEIDEGLRAYMLRVYNYMVLGLAITGFAALGAYMLSVTGDPASAKRSAGGAIALRGGLYLTPIGYTLFVGPLKWLIILAPIVLVFFLSFRIEHMRPATAQLTFWIYAALVGLSLGVLFLVIAFPLALWILKDDPTRKGLLAYGAVTGRAHPGAPRAPSSGRVSISEAMQVPAFWLLAGTFFVCGYTTGGLILTHLVPHAADHGFSEMEAAQALGVMGAMNIIGTVASGWICDRYGRKGPLAFYYALRGVSLLFLLYVWNLPSLEIFAALFGLNYISTVPATTAMTANIFGKYSIGALSGWIYFSHQVGAAIGAAAGGWIFQSTGSYSWAFISGAFLAFLAAMMSLAIKEEPVARTPSPAPVTVPVTAS